MHTLKKLLQTRACCTLRNSWNRLFKNQTFQVNQATFGALQAAEVTMINKDKASDKKNYDLQE